MCTKMQVRMCTACGATGAPRWSHNVFMPDQNAESIPIAEPDWFLREWAEVRAKKQSGLTAELDIHKTTAHRLWTGKQPYRRDFVNLIAAWLGIEPYELLMAPEEAMAIRRLRETAKIIAEGSR